MDTPEFSLKLGGTSSGVLRGLEESSKSHVGRELHAECEWDWRRPLDGTETRLFFDEWRAISSARAGRPLKPSVNDEQLRSWQNADGC